jgi:hypothetical protein
MWQAGSRTEAIMNSDHRHSHSSRGFGFLGTLLASAALSGAITYMLFSPRTGVARAYEPRRHGAISQDVSVDASLVKVEHGWSIQLRATNTTAAKRQCSITATLTRTRSSPMSRVPAMPRTVWTSEVALSVPAHGDTPQRLAIPAAIAKNIPDLEPEPSPKGISDHFGVQVQATCDGSNNRAQVS